MKQLKISNCIAMNYYEQIEKIVLPYLYSYKTDLTTHDKKSLKGYKGRFFYEYRPSGTCLFCVDKYIDALKEILQTGKTEWFNKKAHVEILSGRYSILNIFAYHQVIYNWDHDDRYLIGENGKIRHSSLTEIKDKVDLIDFNEVRPLVLAIKEKWENRIRNFYPVEFGLKAIY
jgi:hypothetical protein